MANNIYARVSSGVVAEIIALDAAINISDVYHPTIVAQMFDVTTVVPPVEVGWIYDGSTFAPPPSLSGNELKDHLKAHSGFKRFQIETAGIMIGGRPANTDRASQAMITSAWTMVQNDPNTTVEWKDRDGNWSTLQGAQIVQFHSAITSHVETCFSTESDISGQIDSGVIVNEAQIDAIYEQIPHLPPQQPAAMTTTATKR